MVGKNLFKYCKEISKVENYELAINDTENIWDCHHRLEIMPFSGNNCSADFLKEQNMYFNVKPEELIFLKHSEHTAIHNKANKGKSTKPLSEETKRKISESMKGHKSKAPWNKGKSLTEEHKRRISISVKQAKSS